MKDISESLAGRVGIIEMNSLSFSELNGTYNDCFIPEIEELTKKQINKVTSKELFNRIFYCNFQIVYF